MESKRFRVRFHLAKGRHYKHWQIIDKRNGFHRDYYDPDKCDIIMRKCRLGNQESTARKIFEGAHKTVCAWVDCDDLDIMYHASPTYEETDVQGMTQYKYNPRRNPHWFTEDCNNCDGEKMLLLTTKGRNIYG
jgi:hypothetical protein